MSTTEVNPLALACEAHAKQFDPNAYYNEYAQPDSPHPRYARTVAKLPLLTGGLPSDLTTMLDLGAGPTVHLLISMRHHVQKMYTSDYSEECRTTLSDWALNKQKLDVDYVCRLIARAEGREETPAEMQSVTREKIEAVLSVDVTKPETIQGVHWRRRKDIELPKKFQVVSCGFILEAAANNREAYLKNVRNACNLIEKGGYMLLIERMGIKSYAVGEKSFETYSSQLTDILKGLEENGMSTDINDGLNLLAGDGICALTSKKL